MNERSPSPSPLRKPLASSKALQALAMASDNEQDENPSDEDEETLQLKLQAIEAKLKLKKLQQAKTKNARRARSPSEDVSESASPRKRLKVSVFPAADVQIPVSPAKDRIKAPQQDTSPARILLGIDKGLRAQDVSLKRPRPGPIFDRSEPKLAAAAPEPRIKSFSERIAESRTNDQAQETKEERIQKARSKGFSLSRPLDASPDTPKPRNTGLRTDGAPSRQCKDTSRNTQSSSQPSSHPAARFSQSSTSASALQASQRPRTSKPESHSDSTNNNNQLLRSSSAEPSADSSSFDPYSSLHLTKRTIPHVDLARTLAGKEIYTLPRLLKEVKSPHYDPPDCEADFVVFAILAAKSTPYDHKPAHHSTGEDETGPLGAPKNKFMVLKLTDLNWELDCFLFDTAFSQYWKLTPELCLQS
ncbi:hypothetical protein H2203_007215 [Taxawa tesnikishii (nom. ined.)]|nr:hypothetical protein H2203_007215 [Dothideales sp. JES 119]